MVDFFFFTFIIVESVVFVCACTSLLLLLLRIVTGHVPHHDNSVACNASVSETQHILKYAKLKLIVALMLVKFSVIMMYFFKTLFVRIGRYQRNRLITAL